jgi:hypothetical protein
MKTADSEGSEVKIESHPFSPELPLTKSAIANDRNSHFVFPLRHFYFYWISLLFFDIFTLIRHLSSSSQSLL